MSETGDEQTALFTFGDTQLDHEDAQAATQTTLISGGHGLAGIGRQLLEAPGSEERQALMREVIQRAGFDSLCYCRIVRIGEFVSRAAWFDTYSPPGWAERYGHEQFFGIDPRVTYACRFEWPFAWDLESMFSTPMAERCEVFARRFTHAMKQAGLHSGVSFGLATGNALEHCIVTLSSAQTGRTRIADTTLGEAYAIGVGLHAFIEARAHSLMPSLTAETLNDVQRSILRFVTQGLSDREMAESLSMSAHNIGYHLRQLKKIYNAQNRVQLAYIAGCILGD
jgi:DNA-binding CsgD family transcriptional regulator